MTQSRPQNINVSRSIFRRSRLPFLFFLDAMIFTLKATQVSKQLADWTSIAKTFHRLVQTQTFMSTPPPTFQTPASRQLYALYNLHINMATYKPLFNLQLAATHVAFMLDHDPKRNVSDSLFVHKCFIQNESRMSRIFQLRWPLLRNPMLCSPFISIH